MTDEKSIWKGNPSQWVNIGPFSGALAVAVGIGVGGVFFPPAWIALLFPLGFAAWKFLVVRTQVFELTTERLRVTRGVINQRVDEVELYRVKDSQLIRTWWMRLTGLASIVMETSDRTLPNLTIPAIRGGSDMRELLRKQVETIRDTKRVREIDFDEAPEEDLASGGA